MKASLLTAGALVCTLASLASAQVTANQRPTKLNKGSAEQQKKLALEQDSREAQALAIKLKLTSQPPQAPQSGVVARATAGPGMPPGSIALVASGSDVCGSPTPISGAGPFGFDANLQTTGVEGQANGNCLFFSTTGIENDAWFAWTSGFTGNAIVGFCGTSAGDSKVAVYAGSGCPGGTAINCNDDFCGLQSQLVFPATSAVVYTVQVGMFPGTAGIPSGTFAITAQPPGPANDNCSAATAISGAGPHAWTNVSALQDGPTNCGTFTGDVWYNWTAGATGNIHAETCGQTGFDTMLSVYDTAACQGALLGCNDQFCGNESRVTFAATSGNVYKVQIGGWNGQTGSGTFTMAAAPPAPANDLCASAVAIAGAGPHAFTNVSALTDGPSNCGTFTKDVWYNWTAGPSGNYHVATCSTAAFDTQISVYDTAACFGTHLNCNDDFCAPESRATFTATVGNVYKIQMGGWNNNEGSGTFSVTLAPPAPANDLCANAVAISGAGPHAFTNISAITDGPSNCGIMTNDVWYNWTSGAAGAYEVSLCAMATPFDTVVSVYDGAGCPVTTLLDCDDDFCAGFGPSKAVFTAAAASVYKIQVGGYNGGEGSGTFTVQPPPPPPANDVCGAFVAISGPGPHNFDNTTATTGTEGQTESLCLAFSSTAVDNDIWYRWTAASSGQGTLTTCGQTSVDTKIGVYPGSPACPAGGSALACNDDSCGLQSVVCWPVTSGQTYTIQLGTFPGANGGSGTFGISVGGGNSVCAPDDGSSEDALGWTAGGEMGYVQRFGPQAGSTSVSSIQISWGTAAFPGGHPANGSPAKVLLYEDPNNDGIPDDLVLVQQVNTTVANVDTDTFNTIAVTPVSMNGYFFAGGGMIHTSGQFVAAMDTNSCHPDDRTHFFGNNNATPVDYTNPQLNTFAPDSFQLNGFACNLMVRAGCSSSPMVGECFPGTGGVINCPCPSQAPANPAGGCANHGAGSTTGGVLSATGSADVSDDTGTPTFFLVTSNHRAPAGGVLNVFFSYKPGAATPTPGTVSAAGIRCTGAGGNLKRLYTVQVFGGTATKPSGADLSVTDMSATFPGNQHTIFPPETRHYFNVFRDGQASLPANCNNPGTTTNLTNMGAVLWAP